jgi:glutathione S-transferase
MRDEPILYDLTDSPFCAKARICLQVKGVAYRRMTLTARKLRELRELNPLGKVPVLIDRGRPIVDSSAIARYLDVEFPDPPLLPDDPAARAYCSVIEDWADEALYFVVGAFKWLNPANRRAAIARTVAELDGGAFAPVAAWLVTRQIVGRYRAWRYTPDALPHFEARMQESLGWLTELLVGRPYLLGRALTLADVAVYAQLAWMRLYAENRLLDGHPAVTDWLARLDAIPAIGEVYTAR